MSNDEILRVLETVLEDLRRVVYDMNMRRYATWEQRDETRESLEKAIDALERYKP